MRIVFVGNHGVDYSSETHHCKTLESMGHEVVRLQEGTARGEEILSESLNSELLVFVHTHSWSTPGLGMDSVFKQLKEAGVSTITYHLDLWFGLKRQRDLESDPFYKSIGHFFTVDKLMAEWFNENTEVKGHYLHAGVFDQECYIKRDVLRDKEIIFVGSKGYHKEWKYRPTLVNFLQETYRDSFTHVGGDGATGTVRGDQLNEMYSRSKVAVGDSLCINFDYPYYWSDRVYETLGRGGFMIHPYIKGMEEDFEDGKHLVYYKFGDFSDLTAKIQYYLEHDEEREAIRLAGHEHVKANHTYKNRWQVILKELGL